MGVGAVSDLRGSEVDGSAVEEDEVVGSEGGGSFGLVGCCCLLAISDAWSPCTFRICCSWDPVCISVRISSASICWSWWCSDFTGVTAKANADELPDVVGARSVGVQAVPGSVLRRGGASNTTCSASPGCVGLSPGKCSKSVVGVVKSSKDRVRWVCVDCSAVGVGLLLGLTKKRRRQVGFSVVRVSSSASSTTQVLSCLRDV